MQSFDKVNVNLVDIFGVGLPDALKADTTVLGVGNNWLLRLVVNVNFQVQLFLNAKFFLNVNAVHDVAFVFSLFVDILLAKHLLCCFSDCIE